MAKDECHRGLSRGMLMELGLVIATFAQAMAATREEGKVAVETLTNKQENGLYKTESRIGRRAVFSFHAAAAVLQRAETFLEVPQQMRHHTICGECRESAVTTHDGSILRDCDSTAAACTGLRDRV